MSVLSFTATASEAGRRLDIVIAARFPTISRSHASRLIRKGYIRVNGQGKKPGYVVRFQDIVQTEIPLPEPI
ncbi:MAG: S4 domain-containing protein, partial [Deltaproteobacteria bacterium]